MDKKKILFFSSVLEDPRHCQREILILNLMISRYISLSLFMYTWEKKMEDVTGEKKQLRNSVLAGVARL